MSVHFFLFTTGCRTNMKENVFPLRKNLAPSKRSDIELDTDFLELLRRFLWVDCALLSKFRMLL